MSIETLVRSLIDALDANTNALLSGGGHAPTTDATASASTSTPKPAKTKTTEVKAAKAAKAAAPSVTMEQVQAALQDVAEKFEPKAAKAIISEVGGVAKMAEIPNDKLEAVFAAASAKLDAGAEDDDGL